MKKSIGIDLGTTNSVVVIKDTSVKIIRNNENEELTRSCVGIRNEEILAGRTAYQLIKRDPINTILSVKRLMGGAVNDKMVQNMIKSPYYKYGITSLKGGTDDSVAIVMAGKQYTPEQISAEILKKLKADAEARLQDEVTHAVITVPAYFTEKQKNATKIAAQLAGLKVKKLLAEPTAAAIAYGVDNIRQGEAKTVLIYDFGGGTFDLSILNIVNGQYIEAGTGGDRWLGGDDIDRKLQQLIINKAQKQYGISDLQALIDHLPDKKRYNFEGEIKIKTEEAKIQLSSSQSAPVIIDGILEDENGESIDIDVTITREEFEKVISPLIERSIDLIEELLKEVRYDISMIDSILLVGGTSCIPLVKQMLMEKFGVGKVKISEKPMLAVAEGAGILAHRLGDEYEKTAPVQSVVSEISYSTNHNYFIELREGFDRIIEKQMPLPYNLVRTYKTTMNNQKIVKVSLYADVEDGRKEKQTMGFFTIDNDLPTGSEIVFDITLGIEEGEIFHIKAYPKMNKSKEKSIVLGRGYQDSKALEFISDSLEKMINSDYSEKQRDFFIKAVQKEIEKINSLNINAIDRKRWEQVSANTFAAFEEAERITDDVNDEELTILFALILLNEYSDILGAERAGKIQQVLNLARNETDAQEKKQELQLLKELTSEFTVLITLFTVKVAAEQIMQYNSSDANKLSQMHNQIVCCFREERINEVLTLLKEALMLRDKYGISDISASIYVTKNGY
ncbi:MAG: Hsp70 family protein [Dysgonamonadaceae bacterium]|nr:Hsp70 family protein [Dysgonamonadaceae bacterium]